MADPTADNPELAVDELKRKARRRLIGAIVLALAAATLLPLLLEQDQKPLGDDVSVQIPPVDDGKFVSRLAGDKGKEAPPAAKVEPKAAGKAEAKSEPAPAPKAEAKAEPVPAPKAETTTEAAPPPKAEAKAKAEPVPSPKIEAKTEPAPQPKDQAKAEATAPGAPTPAPVTDAAPKVEGFIVQLGAFTDAYGANALANRLKRAGYPAFTEPVETSRGKLWRVRVGGYPTRAAANEARDKLKAEGQNGLVSAAK